MNRTKRIFCLVLTLLLLAENAFASETYRGYQYNEWKESVPAPNGYLPSLRIDGEGLGIGKFITPEDIFAAGEKLYILDRGNKRIVILNQEYQLIKVINQFTENGVPYQLKEPQGLFVTEQEEFMIADTENSAVIFCKQDGVITKKITKPDSEIFPQTSDFKPVKVLQDQVNNIYVIISGLFYGSAVFRPDGGFVGFYGSNKIQLTAQILADYIWKKFLTAEQVSKSQRNVPIGYSNFDIDQDNFIYTCTDRIRNGINEIRKLNPVGNNVLPDNEFGDQQFLVYKGDLVDSSFVDVCVDDYGFIYGLDITRGRVFQYDQDGNTIMIFGGKGDQFGTFQTPKAVECMGEDVLVLDSSKAAITVFRKTEFGERVRRALLLFNDGLYDDAKEPWQEVLAMNANFDFAYISIGKSLYNMGEYRQAMRYFRLGNDRISESKAFKEYRTEWLRQRFGIMMALIITLFIAVIYLVNRKRIRVLIEKLRHRT